MAPDQSAEFGLMLNVLAELSLSSFSASRGLDTPKRAGSASVVHMPGYSPIVRIQNVTAPNDLMSSRG
jgi:hypothetical protein